MLVQGILSGSRRRSGCSATAAPAAAAARSIELKRVWPCRRLCSCCSVLLADQWPAARPSARQSGTAARRRPGHQPLPGGRAEEAQVPGKEPGVLVALEAKEGLASQSRHLARSHRRHRTDGPEARSSRPNTTEPRNKPTTTSTSATRVRPPTWPTPNTSKGLEANKQGQRLDSRSRDQPAQAHLAQEQAADRAGPARAARGHASPPRAKGAEVEAAEASIERRKIKAPLDGIVTNVYRHVGEWVAPAIR